MNDEQLSGRKLDCAVAECVMGWRNISNGYIVHDWGGDRPDSGKGIERVPRYSESIEAAMQVEDRIAELGLQSDYYARLVQQVSLSIIDRVFSSFDVVHASAELRSRAAYKAVMEAK